MDSFNCDQHVSKVLHVFVQYLKNDDIARVLLLSLPPARPLRPVARLVGRDADIAPFRFDSFDPCRAASRATGPFTLVEPR